MHCTRMLCLFVLSFYYILISTLSCSRTNGIFLFFYFHFYKLDVVISRLLFVWNWSLTFAAMLFILLFRFALGTNFGVGLMIR